MTDRKTSFAPGPWTINPQYNHEHDCGWRIEAKSGPPVAIACYRGGTGPAKANAYLVAAAPDLYAALEREMLHLEEEYLDLLADIQEGGGPHTARLKEIDDCRQALAKAKPPSPSS